MLRFLGKALGFTPLVVGLVAVNYYVDPANVFHAGEYETSLVNVLMAGRNVANYRPADERLVQKLYVERQAAAAETVAIGSSRLLQLTAADTAGRFFNHAVSGGTLRDAAAIYGLLRERGRGPRTVILGIDPWSFVPAPEDGLVQSLWPEYRAACAVLQYADDELSAPSRLPAKTRELVSLRSFQVAVASLMASHGRVTRPLAEATPEREGESAIKRADGSLAYAAAFRSRPASVVRAEVEQTLRRSPYLSKAFAPAEPHLIDLANRLIALMRRDGARVVLWRSPLHPAAYAALAANPDKRRQMVEMDTWFSEQTRQHGVILASDFNPAVDGVDESGFYDALHPKREIVATAAARAGLPAAAEGQETR